MVLASENKRFLHLTLKRKNPLGGMFSAYFSVEKEVWNGERLFVGFNKEDDG